VLARKAGERRDGASPLHKGVFPGVAGSRGRVAHLVEASMRWASVVGLGVIGEESPVKRNRGERVAAKGREKARKRPEKMEKPPRTVRFWMASSPLPLPPRQLAGVNNISRAVATNRRGEIAFERQCLRQIRYIDRSSLTIAHFLFFFTRYPIHLDWTHLGQA
jgi:hypothetical protein